MNRIRQLREDMDLRQSDVAEATGIDQRTLSNYETGKTNPDSYAIIQLADFFGVSSDYLIGRTDERAQKLLELEKDLQAVQEELSKIRNKLKSI